jgi:3-methylcrotonyl-CoA carboxylase alpha subunit
MFSKILIANRGEIACRIIKTAREMGVQTVAVYSDADANALHVKMADQAIHIGPSPAADSYLQMDTLIDAAQSTGAQAIHPGYGFLSENPDFAQKIADNGMVFIGPSPESIRQMGLKDRAKELMEIAGVPVVPGYHGDNQDPAFLASEAEKIGYPVLIKARAGGGGKGMRLVENPADFETLLQSAQREGLASFGDAHVLIEKFIQSPRHIEVQVFGDTHGNVVHLFERDCSMQRRHQKVIEEAPAPDMPADLRAAMTDAAIKAAKQIDYFGAGTIEFIVDGSGPLRADGFWFMEMNTRLQVEHPVTEAVTGTDLVAWQLRVASGEALPLKQDEITLNGHAFEARIYAEDPTADFKPAPGTLSSLQFNTNARIDTGVESGDVVSPFYDPMIAKITTHAADRETALNALVDGLQNTVAAGTPTNLGFLSRLATDTDFATAKLDTGLIERKMDALSTVPEVSDFDILCAIISTHDIDLNTPRLGWQMWQAPAIKTAFNECGNVSLTIYDNTVKVGETTFTRVTRNADQITATANNTQHRATATVAGNTVTIKSAADAQTLTIPTPLDVAAGAGENSDQIAAPMTGTVTMVHINAGDTVTAGDPLVVMEAMKMEHVLTAPRDGTIAAVFCSQSDATSEGTILVSFVETDA